MALPIGSERTLTRTLIEVDTGQSVPKTFFLATAEDVFAGRRVTARFYSYARQRFSSLALKRGPLRPGLAAARSKLLIALNFLGV